MRAPVGVRCEVTPPTVCRSSHVASSLRRGARIVRRVTETIARAQPADDGLEALDDAWDNGPFLLPEGSPPLARVTDPTVWRLMQEMLIAGEVEQVLPERAQFLMASGWTLVDVRPYPDYCKRHAWGAKNCQLFVPLEVGDFQSFAKAAISYAIFPERIGAKYVNVTENKEFVEEMVAEVGWGARVIVYCKDGGIIGSPEFEYKDGRQTSSLIAAHELVARGWGSDNVKHMAGGVDYWDEALGLEVGQVDE